ncbi:ComEA family DNA-binding protein [Microseira sp. BLCC-F43]|uniref:ComEA family DNA-binding protein n=1 Tax=Microseira sp. BLCC-F43 TaxID=3153602 RepID=UPI0035B75A6D
MKLFNWLAHFRNIPRSQSLRRRLLNDPYYRMQSLEEIALASSLGIKIDANLATVDDWLRLPGLSIHQARSLVELSHAGVCFYCLEDIAAALGLPVASLKYLEPVLSFYYYDDESIYTTNRRINPYTASVEMLTQIRIIDLFLAQAIVQNRSAGGQYRNLADLQRRLSLPGDTIGKLMHYLRF